MDDQAANHEKEDLERLISFLPGQHLNLEIVKSAIIDHDAIAVLVADDDGNYIYANEAASSLFGYSPKEFTLMNVRDLRLVGGINPIKQYKSFLNDGSMSGVLYFYDKSDRPRVGLYRARRIAEDINLSIMVDVTDQYGAFDDIVDQLSQQSDVLSNLPSVSFRYNVKNDGTAMFSFVSDNVTKVLRLQSKKSHLDWTLGDLVVDDDRPAFMEAAKQSIADATPLLYQARMRLGDGSIEDFEVRSYPVKKADEVVFYGTFYLIK
jgi:PAS domain S-box-containing protein